MTPYTALTALAAVRSWLRLRVSAEDGAVATEYVLLLTFIAIAIIAVIVAFGGQLAGMFQSSCNALPPTSTAC